MATELQQISARFDDLEQKYNALLQRAHTSEEEHRKTHAELALVRQGQTSSIPKP